MTTKKTTLNIYKNFLSLSLVQFLNYGISFLITPYLTRILGIEKFGLISFAQAFVYYFTLIIIYSFDFTATREIAIQQNEYKVQSNIFYEVISTKLFLFVFSSLLFILCLYTIPKLYTNSNLFIFTYLINIGFLLLPNWFFQGNEFYREITVFSFLSKIMLLILLLFFIKSKNYYWLCRQFFFLLFIVVIILIT